MRMLPIVKLGETLYFMDRRLKEFRNTKNPHDRITFPEFTDIITQDMERQFEEKNPPEAIKEGQINVSCLQVHQQAR